LAGVTGIDEFNARGNEGIGSRVVAGKSRGAARGGTADPDRRRRLFDLVDQWDELADELDCAASRVGFR